MSDDPRPPFQVPPGGGADDGPPPLSVPGTPGPPPLAMPPLGPPYVTTPGGPPPPQYPLAPPNEWPAAPPRLPVPVPAPPVGPRWSDRFKRPAVVWGAVAIVMAVLLGALVGRSTNDELAGSAVAPTTSTAPRRTAPSTSSSDASSSSSEPRSTTTTEPQDLNSVVQDIEKFVERERGLTYKNPVDVHLAGEGEFQTRLLKDFDKERPGLVEEQQVLTALGLVPAGTDVVADSKSLLAIGVVGFYDPETKQLVVRGSTITPYVREVLAHELTHALDDQWFNLNRPELDNADDETGFGFLGLTEGNARRIENAYLGSLSQDEQDEANAEEQRLVAQHPEIFRLPSILISLLQAPYDEGEPFVDAVLAAGGQAALDNAFRTPPVSSEQVLEPQRYIAGEVPIEQATPPADGPSLNVGVLGELLLREMLSDASASGSGVPRAVQGWGGDKYVTWSDASGASCLRDTFVGDTPADTSELTDALTRWAGDHHGSVTSSDGHGTLTVCSR